MTSSVQQKLTPTQETSVALISVFNTVSTHGPIRLNDVVRLSGVIEIQAWRALKTLLGQRFVLKSKDGYRVR